MRTQTGSTDLRIPNAWELLTRFKGWCRLKGWETSEHGDWVKTGDNKYHNFLWSQTVHPSTFKKIAGKHKCVLHNGTFYQVVDVSYTAWLFLQSPPENIVKKVRENPRCSKTTSIYDLSHAFTDKPFYLKLNETNSIVLKEFERFLEEELAVEVNSIHKIRPSLQHAKN